MSISEGTTQLQDLSESPEGFKKDGLPDIITGLPQSTFFHTMIGVLLFLIFSTPGCRQQQGVDDLTIKAEDSQCSPQSYGDEISNSDKPPPSADRQQMALSTRS